MSIQSLRLAGCLGSLIVALVSARLAAQEPNAASATSPLSTTVLRLRQQPGGTASVEDPSPIGGRAGPTGRTERLAQKPAGPEVLRPGAPGTQPPLAQPPAELPHPREPLPSPFGPTQFRLPTLGLPPGLGTPEPTPEVKKTFGKFVEREIAPENTIQVVEGRAKKIKLREKPRRTYIPDETVAGLQIITDQEFAIVGKKQGSTVLDLWFADAADPADLNKDQELEYLVIVLPDLERAALEVMAERQRLEAQAKAFQEALKVLEREIKEAFPDSAVQLSLIGDQTVVRGESKDIVEAAQILRIVGEHVPNTRRSKTEPNTSLNTFFIPGLPGMGDERAAVDAIREVLQGHPNMVNLLRVPGEQQVMLMVTVAEVNRDASRSIGINFSIAKGAAVVGQFTGGLLAAAGGNTAPLVNLPISIDNGQVLIAIQALRQLNLARSLAEPNLTTLNGRTANFHAGGSFPIPNSVILQGGAAQSVTYVPLGVDLAFTPYITDRSRVRLELHADVSSASASTTQVSGGSVPSNLDRRTFNTTVELREGQTLAVAGLIQKNFGNKATRIPLWGDLPVIGRTGGLDSVTSSEQELVILVTPVLVHPLDLCKAPQIPGQDVFEPGDIEFYLLGHLEGRRTVDYRASVRNDFARQHRYIRCNDRYIIGPYGTTYACCKAGECPSSCPEAGPGQAYAASPEPMSPARAPVVNPPLAP